MSINEKVVEVKTCPNCNSNFEITDKDLEFYEKVSPSFGGKKYNIPSPTLCPNCRQQRRLSFRNERKLYKRICDATGKPIISMYSPDKPYKVYSEEIWWSDKWDVLKYGVDFDFTKSFFSQFEELVKIVPHNNLINHFMTNENSMYGNFTGNNKDSYLVFEAGSLEKAYYCENIRKSKNIIDSTGCFFCENSYNLIECYHCTNCKFCIDSNNCLNSEFLCNCKNCENCFMSYNLVDKKYVINNKQYTENEYYEIINELKNSNSLDKLYLDFLNNNSKRISLYSHGFGNENCTGDYLYNSSNSFDCFDARNLENCKYCSVMSSSKDKTVNCYDYDFFGSSEKSYEIVTVGSNSFDILFSINTWDNASNILYCYNCTGSKNCFGCFGVTYKQYCILNKQYTKEEYEILVPKIIEHMMTTKEWGEFFPSSISPFGYNETIANEYFPLTREQAINPPTRSSSPPLPKGESGSIAEAGGLIRGLFNRSDYEAPFPKVDKIIPAKKLPENIKDIPDDILNRAIECEITKKPFRIIAQELEFYRKHNLPIPKRHPDQRHLDRMNLRNPRKLFDRKCDKCNKEIKATYSPDRKEIVYCEECYNKEIY
ncbi:MAG: hypothetical protein PHE25_00685 [Candidatus Gracilibacteria bacterium]|nr:hypothetical protein [Candidatus Gracilibacteria bacterium]